MPTPPVVGEISRAFLEMIGFGIPDLTIARGYLEITGKDLAPHAVVSRAFIEIIASTATFPPPEPPFMNLPTPLTSLMCFGVPRTRPPTPFHPKPAGGLPPVGYPIPDFDIWRAGYAAAKVQVVLAGTTQPAPVYTDVLLTQPALNPQILKTQTDADGRTYGMWEQPIYTYAPYFLLINDTDTTGIVYPPLTTLVGSDASFAAAAATRGGFPTLLRSWLDRQVHVSNFGTWSATGGSTANTTTLISAIGAAAAQGGGSVMLPAGTYPINPIVLPEGVILEGQGLSATTLQCQSGSPVVILAGDGAGLRNLVLDGVVLATGSYGIDCTGLANVVFEHVLIQRFSTGMRAKGLQACVWTDFSLSNCNTAMDLRGDQDAALTASGSLVQNIAWNGGSVTLNVISGVILEVIDLPVENLVFENVQFASNQAPAVTLTGAHDVRFLNCDWDSNLTNWLIGDGTNPAFAFINTCRNIIIDGGQVQGGQVSGAKCIFSGTCANTKVRDATVANCSIVLTSPLNQVTFEDCYIDPSTSVTGTLTLYALLRTSDTAIVNGVTVDNSATPAWQLQLRPGQVAFVEAQAIAKQENGVNYGTFWEACGAEQPGATLNYFSGTSPFTVPAVLQGLTSKAVALIQAKSGTTATGSLTLIDQTGTFQSGETITDGSGGQAQVSGPMAFAATVLDSTGQTHVRAPTVSGGAGYAVFIAASGAMIQVQVQGTVAHTVAWQVKVKVVVN